MPKKYCSQTGKIRIIPDVTSFPRKAYILAKEGLLTRYLSLVVGQPLHISEHSLYLALGLLNKSGRFTETGLYLHRYLAEPSVAQHYSDMEYRACIQRARSRLTWPMRRALLAISEGRQPDAKSVIALQRRYLVTETGTLTSLANALLSLDGHA